MALRPTVKSVVVLANTFNPSVFTGEWLDAMDVFAKAETGGKLIYTPKLVTFNGPASFFVVDDRLQISLDATSWAVDAATKVKKIVSQLPHIPYTAVGFNFNWQYEPNGETLTDWANRNFTPTNAAAFGAGAAFGLNATRQVSGSRHRTTITLDDGKADVHMNYNFVVSTANGQQEILSALDLSDALCRDSDTLASQLCP